MRESERWCEKLEEIMVEINDYEIEKECIYKDEHYLVRDNGAILRLPKNEKRPRKSDNIWTFGKCNPKTGYLLFCGERVHRIVAYAFLGEPPSDKHVIDHIDTNRCNNRPENLRWLTRLENVLNNPITCAKIKNICGSIEVFLRNPSILRGHEYQDINFSWMRSVTREEAQYCLSRLSQWANNPKKPKGEGIGEWIFKSNPEEDPVLKKLNSAITYSHKEYTNAYQRDHHYNSSEEMEVKEGDDIKFMETQSLTPNAIQVNWRNPVRFCLCPQSPKEEPLKEYMNNLKKGELFCEYEGNNNHFSPSIILDYAMPTPDVLWVICKVQIGFKTHAFTKVTYQDGIFYHLNCGLLDPGDEIDEIIKDIKEGRENDL